MSKKVRKNYREVETSWGDIFRCLKEGLIGSEEDFDDDSDEDFEEVEKAPKTKKVPAPEVTPAAVTTPAQKSAPEVTPAAVTAPIQKQVSEPAPAQVQIQAPVKEVFPTQKTEEAAEAAIWKTLRSNLNRFVQSGQASESLLQLMEEGFEKNPQLLHEIVGHIESRKTEEKIHPGYLMEYGGKLSMISSKERAFELFTQRPGSTIRETIFVSKMVEGRATDTREASEEEKKLYYEQQSSKADASGQEDQGQ